MHLSQLAIFAVFLAYGLAAPITHQGPGSSPSANVDENTDPVFAAGKTPPFNPSWHYCQTACDCSRFKKETEFEPYFQCMTNPNCEQCARQGMSPSAS